jgi:DnaJ-class molecular chaperone
LALLHHPDKQSPNKGRRPINSFTYMILTRIIVETKEFEKIKAAYDIIGDPSKRALYERWKSSSLIIPFSDFANLGTHAQVSLFKTSHKTTLTNFSI